MMNFKKDLTIGQEAEKYFSRTAEGWEVLEVDDDNKSYYDLKLICGERNITVEVKNDIASHKTGNLGFEYQQTDWRGGKKPSGFMISKADYWVHFYYFKKSVPVKGKYIMVDLAYLRAFLFGIVIKSGKYKIIPDAGDNGNDLMIVKREICESLFSATEKIKKCSIHTLSENEIKTKLKKTFKGIEKNSKEWLNDKLSGITIT